MTKKETKKILREPFYNAIYKETNSFDLIDEGGFFFDNNDTPINWKEHVNLLCTPINFLKPDPNEFDPCKKCVLISTGAFSPLHDGHIEMMVSAKKTMQENGWHVLGGYLSPGHDEYIKQKTGNDWIPIHDRIAYANDQIKQYDWLAIDPWEGVFAPGAVNFTSVVYRLSMYLKKHFSEDVSIFFVCGADNARFSLAFKNYRDTLEFGTVVINRPNYADRINKYETDENTNTYFGFGNNHMSSTQLRKEGFKMHEKPTQLYFRHFWNHFEKSLKIPLKKQFKFVWSLDIKEQNERRRELHLNIEDDQIVNLDIESDFGSKIDMSRLYDLYGQKQLGYTQRPETKLSIEDQIKRLKLKDKEVYLFDDDICSGKTMQFVENLLQDNGYTVKGKFSYITSNENTEILDAKDFIIGIDGGLVVNYNKKPIRVPYIYPFVCPTTRANISDPLEFSIDIWKMNMHKHEKETVYLSQVNMQWTYKIGFNKNSTVYDFCKYYYEFLTDLKKHYN